MEINYVSIQRGLSKCKNDGAHLTSASLESGEYINYIPEKGFYLGEQLIGRTHISLTAVSL